MEDVVYRILQVMSLRMTRYPGFITVLIGVVVIVISFALYMMVTAHLASMLMGVGIALLATGLNELSKFYASTTELKKPGLDLEIFRNDQYRVSALIKNESSVTIKDAKAMMDLEEPSLKKLSEVIMECNECGKCDEKKFLVNKDNPRIKGDLLPWATPEKPIKRPVLRGSSRFPIVYTDYVHITSISPHQGAKLLLFDLTPLNRGSYLIRFFSEYGAKGPDDPTPRYYRVCMRLEEGLRIGFRVTVTGDGLRKPLKFRVLVERQKLDAILGLIRGNKIEDAFERLKEMPV